MERALDTTLSRHGIRLLEDESISSALDLKSGSTGRFTSGLILTNRRVIHISRRSRRSAITATLEDIPSIAVKHEPKQHWLIAVGAALALGGLVIAALAGSLASYTVAAPDNLSLFIGLPVALFGAILAVWGLSTGSTQIEMQLGNREISAELKSSALEDAEDFVANFFQAKAR